ncbi:DUF1295 domain-containing protein [Alloscardovia venturai]|uniref:DUF1295 domain-containing protein n=1 Tax=Alloscardovia venturai TaxID=1769421 RepID=A0ABW2Y660_9BIFI
MWIYFLACFLICLVCTAIGFKNYIWFMSIGYGIAVAGAAVGIEIVGICQGVNPSLPFYILDKLLLLQLFVYGVRLSTFLSIRESESRSYRSALKANAQSHVSVAAKFGIWCAVSILYVLQVSPVMFRIANRVETTAGMFFGIVGFVISFVGFMVEATADNQKSAAKKKNPHDFVSSGLFKFVRCPNYLGEIVFWTGIFISGWGALNNWWQWVCALLGYAMIVGVMVSGAQRLEKRQNKNYGDRIEYQQYAQNTPMLIPLLKTRHSSVHTK